MIKVLGLSGEIMRAADGRIVTLADGELFELDDATAEAAIAHGWARRVPKSGAPETPEEKRQAPETPEKKAKK